MTELHMDHKQLKESYHCVVRRNRAERIKHRRASLDKHQNSKIPAQIKTASMTDLHQELFQKDLYLQHLAILFCHEG